MTSPVRVEREESTSPSAAIFAPARSAHLGHDRASSDLCGAWRGPSRRAGQPPPRRAALAALGPLSGDRNARVAVAGLRLRISGGAPADRHSSPRATSSSSWPRRGFSSARRRARRLACLPSLLIATDIAALAGFCYLTSSPQELHRILLLGFLSMQLGVFYFGRAPGHRSPRR